jgi:hypothetical protein
MQILKMLEKIKNELKMYWVSQVLPPQRKHPLILIDLKFSKNSGMIV